MSERTRAIGRVTMPPTGALYRRGVEILSGEHAGVLFALDHDEREPFGSCVTVEFTPEDQFAYIVR